MSQIGKSIETESDCLGLGCWQGWESLFGVMKMFKIDYGYGLCI